MIEVFHTSIGDADAIVVGPGCIRRDLPDFNGNRAWIVEIEPGHVWPYPDQHDDKGELVLVLEGDLVEGNNVYEAGTYLIYGPNSIHTPTTTGGVKLFGLNSA